MPTCKSVAVRLTLPADAGAANSRARIFQWPLAGEVSLFVTPLMSPSGLHAAATGALAPACPCRQIPAAGAVGETTRFA